MKLLFDENLSPRLPELLGGEFPASNHIRDVGLLGAADSRVCDYASDNGFVIVSKDNDFRQRSFLDGAPPKVIWLGWGMQARLRSPTYFATNMRGLGNSTWTASHLCSSWRSRATKTGSDWFKRNLQDNAS